MNRVPAALAILMLSACNSDALIRKFTPADADARDRAYLALFVRGHQDSAAARLLPSLQTPAASGELAKMAALLATARMESMKVVGANTATFAASRRVSLTYELSAKPGGWLLANVLTVDSAGTWFVDGAHVESVRQPLEESARFALSGKSPLFYMFLLVTILCAAVSIGAALFMATRKQMPNHWWWALASLIGVGAFSLNWTSGQTAFTLLNVQLLSAGAIESGPYAPWVLKLAFPLGAVIALPKYRSWRNLPEPSRSPAGESPR